MQRVDDYVYELSFIMPKWKAYLEAQNKFSYGEVYGAYLRSDEWKEFRDRVLSIRPTCECCLVREASEVHHLSYRYLFLENGGMVQAVCRPCHEAMTGYDKLKGRI